MLHLRIITPYFLYLGLHPFDKFFKAILVKTLTGYPFGIS